MGRFRAAARAVRAAARLRARVRWTPWNVPLRRRLETFFTALWLFMIPVGTLTIWALFLLMMLWKVTAVPAALYLAWIFLVDNSAEHGSRVPYLRRAFIWGYVRDYFPIELRRTAELDPKRSYVFGYHPHVRKGGGGNPPPQLPLPGPNLLYALPRLVPMRHLPPPLPRPNPPDREAERALPCLALARR